LSICKIVEFWSENDAWDICNISGFVPYMVGLEMGMCKWMCKWMFV
jgi:hypothetical protein